MIQINTSQSKLITAKIFNMEIKVITGSVDVHANEKNTGGIKIEAKIKAYIEENNIKDIKNVLPVQVQWVKDSNAYYTLFYSVTLIL